MRILNYLSNWYFSKGALPYWGVLFLDCLIVLFSGYVGSYVEIGGYEFAMHFWSLTMGNLLMVLIFALSFRFFHTYTGILRYSSLIDLERVGWASFVGTCVSYALALVVNPVGGDKIIMHTLLGSVVIFVCSSMLMWIERMCVRAMFDVFRTDKAMPVVIYGTKNGGLSLANSLKEMKDKKYVLYAFISDVPKLSRAYILGKKVYYNKKGLAAELKGRHVKAMLVSPLKSEALRNNQAMIDEFVKAGIKIMIMPVAKLWDGKSDLTTDQLHEIEIEDLLPREKINVDMNAIGAMLKDKRVLITGAAGSIGSEMVRQISVYHPAELVLIDQAETPMHGIRLMMKNTFADVKNETIVGSITDQSFMEYIFKEHRPEYVFHAAAYKHVPMMEDNPEMAVRNNINGTRVIADLAVKYGTKKFVMISTDKAVNPTNVMGCSKRICEIYCQSLNQAIIDGRVKGETQFVTTRFGNVLGSNGSVIPLFKEMIRKGGPLKVTHPDIIRYFMLIPEACKLVLEAGTMGKGGEIFVFDMGKPVRIADLAKRMIALSGVDGIDIKYVGLRDGEKLFEEVLNDKEATVPTHHPKIMVAKVREYPYDLARKNEEELYQLSFTYDDMAVVKKMKEIVPEYKSQHSKYSELDHN